MSLPQQEGPAGLSDERPDSQTRPCAAVGIAVRDDIARLFAIDPVGNLHEMLAALGLLLFPWVCGVALEPLYLLGMGHPKRVTALDSCPAMNLALREAGRRGWHYGEFQPVGCLVPLSVFS